MSDEQLKWCPDCGEGVTTLCRGKTDECKTVERRPQFQLLRPFNIGFEVSPCGDYLALLVHSADGLSKKGITLRKGADILDIAVTLKTFGEIIELQRKTP